MSGPRPLLLTHIHFDHAGASGSLVERWPDLRVYVHERGAKHMMDPTRLYNSARRLYGDDMERLWGEMLPVPEANLEILSGGETIRDGAYKVQYTPGHASHHVSYLHDGTAFVGDVGGVRIRPESMTIPPTPPPDVDVEAWHESIALVRAWRPRAAGDDPLRVKRGRRPPARRARTPGSTRGPRSPVTRAMTGSCPRSSRRSCATGAPSRPPPMSRPPPWSSSLPGTTGIGPRRLSKSKLAAASVRRYPG